MKTFFDAFAILGVVMVIVSLLGFAVAAMSESGTVLVGCLFSLFQGLMMFAVGRIGWKVWDT